MRQEHNGSNHDHHDHDHDDAPADHVHTHGTVSHEEPQSRYRWQVHHPYENIHHRAAIEVAPMEGFAGAVEVLNPVRLRRCRDVGRRTARSFTNQLRSPSDVRYDTDRYS